MTNKTETSLRYEGAQSERQLLEDFVRARLTIWRSGVQNAMTIARAREDLEILAYLDAQGSKDTNDHQDV